MHIILIPFIPVLASAIVMYAIGLVWYSPILFGNMWKRLSGVDTTTKLVGRKAYATLGLGLVSSVVSAYVLGIVINNSVILSLHQGLLIGFWMWFGFVVPVFLSQYLWSTNKRPITAYLIDVGQLLVAFVIGSLILTLTLG